jgi:hypothetical protein
MPQWLQVFVLHYFNFIRRYFLNRLSDVSVECRAEVSHLFCSLSELIASMKTDCPGPEDESECTKCRSSNDRRYGASKWILTWLDSVGKMPSGISDGNYHWLGDYEQCQRLKRSGMEESDHMNRCSSLPSFSQPTIVQRPLLPARIPRARCGDAA